MKRISEFPGMTEEDSMYCILRYQYEYHSSWFTPSTKLIEVEPSAAAIEIESRHYAMAFAYVYRNSTQFVWATSQDNFKHSLDIMLEDKIYNIQELNEFMV